MYASTTRLWRGVAWLLVALWLPLSTPAHGEDAIALRDTAAAREFLNARYDVALEEFRKLARTNPNNVLVLRYLAITLGRLQRYDEAVRVFQEALAIAPNNVALHFHLGATYYNARQGAKARQSFTQVRKLAPDSRYAQLAWEYLDALAQQDNQSQRQGAPERFGVYAQVGYQHDDNIVAAPRDPVLYDGRRAGNSLVEYLSLKNHLLRNADWLGTVELSGYGAQYTRSDFHASEFAQYSASGLLQRPTTLWGFPFIGSLKYEYFRTQLADGGNYSRSRAFTLGSRVGLTDNTTTQLFYRYTNDDFANEGFDPHISSRDADNHAFGVTQTWYFAERQGHVNVGYEYQDNRADGLNFMMVGHKWLVGAGFPLVAGLRAEMAIARSADDYTRFQGPVRRETARREFSAGLSRWFGQHFLARMDYSYVDEGSNYDQLSYQRRTWGLKAGYVY